jgi:hypothetical protein
MKLVRTLSLLITLVGASTALAQTPPAKAPAEKKAPPEAEKKAEFNKAEVAKLEAFFNDFAKAVVDNKDACGKMGPAIKVVLDKHLEAVRPLIESGKDLPKADKDRLKPKQDEVTANIIKCKDDKSVAEQFQRLLGAMMAKKKDAKADAPTTAPAPPPPAAKK